LTEHSDKILTAIMTGMRPEAGPKLITEAARAFYHCIESASKNFSRPKERDLIMAVVHSTCNHDDDDIKVLGLECLVEIARVYYEHLGQYMEGLYTVTIAAIKHEEEEIAKQGVEFWCTLTDSEMDIQWQIEVRGYHVGAHAYLSVRIPGRLRVSLIV
jgi:importin subunit beta-1